MEEYWYTKFKSKEKDCFNRLRILYWKEEREEEQQEQVVDSEAESGNNEN